MKQVGEFVVKGLAYEDVIGILGNSGYATEVFTPKYNAKNTKYMDIEHRIRVYEVEEAKVTPFD